jgi:hypothetical protein
MSAPRLSGPVRIKATSAAVVSFSHRFSGPYGDTSRVSGLPTALENRAGFGANASSAANVPSESAEAVGGQVPEYLITRLEPHHVLADRLDLSGNIQAETRVPRLTEPGT